MYVDDVWTLEWTQCFWKVSNQFDSDFKDGTGQSCLFVSYSGHFNDLNIVLQGSSTRLSIADKIEGQKPKLDAKRSHLVCRVIPWLNNNYKTIPQTKTCYIYGTPSAPLPCLSWAGPRSGPWGHRNITAPSAMPLSLDPRLSSLDPHLLFSTSLLPWSPGSQPQNSEHSLPMSKPLRLSPQGRAAPLESLLLLPAPAHHICTSGLSTLERQDWEWVGHSRGGQGSWGLFTVIMETPAECEGRLFKRVGSNAAGQRQSCGVAPSLWPTPSAFGQPFCLTSPTQLTPCPGDEPHIGSWNLGMSSSTLDRWGWDGEREARAGRRRRWLLLGGALCSRGSRRELPGMESLMEEGECEVTRVSLWPTRSRAGNWLIKGRLLWPETSRERLDTEGRCAGSCFSC